MFEDAEEAVVFADDDVSFVDGFGARILAGSGVALFIIITRFFRISLDTWMIYDHKVLIADDQGVEKPRVQFKEAAGLRFTYLISNKK